MAYCTNQVILRLDIHDQEVQIFRNTPKPILKEDFYILFETEDIFQIPHVFDFATEVSFNTTRNTSFCCYDANDIATDAANDDQNCHKTTLNSESS